MENGPLLTFGILGTVEVRSGDRVVAVASAKQQALLGAGLLHANAVVPTARLVDAIWGERPPSTAADLVQTYVSTLRRRIGPPDSGCIVTRPPGYLVRVDRGALDLHQFEQLAAAAERAATGGDHECAVRLLREALGKWRGPALAGLDSPLFRAAAARLEELRLLAVERRFDAESQLGASGWLVAELTAFVAEHPLRESTRALLMRVLYRLGRQAEALQVYQQGYALLREELGIEPGPGLQRLHQAILVGNPALDPGGAQPEPVFGGGEHPQRPPAGARIDLGDAPAAARPPAPAGPADDRPHQLPPPPAHLVGRAAENRALGTALAAAAGATRPVLVTVDGPAGVGKTALALAVAHRVRNTFPDGQLFVPVRSTGPQTTTVAATLAMLLRSVGAGTPIPPSVDERAARLRTVLTGRRVLLVLDDVWCAAQVRPFLTAHPGCAVLVTGRPALADLDADLRVPLGPLTYRQAVELLTHAVGAQRVEAEAGAAGDVVSACDGLPLAVRAAAARLVARPGWALATLADRLLDPRRRLDELSTGDLDVRASIEGGYRRLDAAGRSALRRLGAADDTDLAPARVAQLLQMSPRDAERIADDLAGARLLEYVSTAPGDRQHYRIPRLVRLFAQEQVPTVLTG
ncbi:MAG: hypothetical protein V7603_4038 [Micromonosporaceae bacterium]